MPKLKAFRRRYACAALGTLMALVYIFAVMHFASGADPLEYRYNSYLLQARAWLQGRIALQQNISHLELAVYEGQYYVSFPPVPAIPMVLWTLVFGEDVPGGLIQKMYIIIACMVVLAEVMRSKKLSPLQGSLWSLGICICSAMLPISLVGGVWYEAQILAFLLCVGAISALRRNRITLACLLYALSVGCRPFCAVLGPVLLMMFLSRKNRPDTKRLVPGILLGLCIAAAYALYNYIRFGNIFEFGHNYLPEFTRAQHGQLSLRYVPRNFSQLFFGSPFTAEDGKTVFYEFGFSMFLSCPILIVSLIWLAQDLAKRKMNGVKWMCLLMGALNTLLLLMHRTLGGHQFGLRYALELVPLCLCWYLASPGRRKMRWWEGALLAFGLMFNFIGGCIVHI